MNPLAPVLRTFRKASKSISRRGAFDFLDRHLSTLPADARVLNVGAGGAFGEQIVQIANRIGFSVTQSDIAEERQPDIVDDITNSKLPDDSYDAIVMLSVIEHVTNPFLAAQEVQRILKPGGMLLVAAPFLYPIHDRPNDYFRFTKYGLRNLFSGTEIFDLEEQGNWLETPCLIYSRLVMERKRSAWLAGLFMTILIFPALSIGSMFRRPLMNASDAFPFGYFLAARKPAIAPTS